MLRRLARRPERGCCRKRIRHVSRASWNRSRARAEQERRRLRQRVSLEDAIQTDDMAFLGKAIIVSIGRRSTITQPHRLLHTCLWLGSLSKVAYGREEWRSEVPRGMLFLCEPTAGGAWHDHREPSVPQQVLTDWRRYRIYNMYIVWSTQSEWLFAYASLVSSSTLRVAYWRPATHPSASTRTLQGFRRHAILAKAATTEVHGGSGRHGHQESQKRIGSAICYRALS